MFKHRIDKINSNNKSYPGGRGTDELVVFTKDHKNASTQTNEFGTEVVVKKGVVVEFGSNNYQIPRDGFVVSGHGKAQMWLENVIWYGSEVKIEGSELVVITDKKTESQGVPLFQKQMKKDIGKFPEIAGDLTREAAETIYYQSLPSKKKEVRGIWHEQTEKSPSQIKKTVKRLKDAGFNLLLLEVFYHGHTIYPSDLVGQMKEYHGWDPLEVWCAECNNAGIEIHPWVHCFFGGFDTPGSVTDLHPEWLAKRRDGKKTSDVERGFYWLEPALDEVQDFLIDLFKELFAKYKFGALHLDYIRYGETPSLDEMFSFSDHASKVFKDRTGFDAKALSPKDEAFNLWLKFRQDTITKFVRRCRKEFPEVLLSTAIFPELEQAKERKGQDWALWLEEGLLDYLAPMIYSTDTEYVVKMMEFAKTLNPKIPVYAGIGPFMGFTPFRLVKQAYRASQVVPGTIHFALHSVRKGHMEALKKSIYREDATLPWN